MKKTTKIERLVSWYKMFMLLPLSVAVLADFFLLSDAWLLSDFVTKTGNLYYLYPNLMGLYGIMPLRSVAESLIAFK